ncbi:hypothetical protein HYFRA_00005986 [Hymenoscyphus fraxineus]|uniref:Zn(2)-C6 fungal-type domain-containing protein n=1 Tax=Hymenoscyphus fraxineus TaxID=746836 RepID=A0A9N9KWH2_9HELO|nr:hypothetical protein HYFRA_00005986 [Hymenoscyphus fraxineus]
MPTSAGFQTVFRFVKDAPDGTSGQPQPRVAKRNRQSISCSTCRSRKLKCDRQRPCSSCVKRGDGIPCTYAGPIKDARSRNVESRGSEVQLRLQKLEEMVTGLMHKTKEQNEPRNFLSDLAITPPEMIDPSLKTFTGSVNEAGVAAPTEHSQLCDNDSGTRYLGATNWTTVLQNIREIQDVLDTGVEEEPTPNNLPSGQNILLDCSPMVPFSVLCSSLPPRATVDNLMSAYFNAKHNQSPIIHSTKFLREYEEFWKDHSSASPLWISMLYSAMYLASQFNEASGTKDLSSSNPRIFLTRAKQALLAGEYQKGKQYSLEALLFYLKCNFVLREDYESSSWMIMGITAKLALRMGYHRDPKTLKNITPFEGEMRRRTFFLVEVMDLLLSFQAGVPPTIQEDECDTEPPSNLFDTDFSEDCEVLPPSRPSSDPTPMLYYCVKSHLAKLLRRVIRHALSLKSPSYSETMKLEHELSVAYANIPSSLRPRPLNCSFTDPAYIILHRLNIELLRLRCSCVLHRKYLNHDRLNPAFQFSRDKCLDSALKILEYQRELHYACLPGGQLYNDRWMPSSLIMYDFLLAVMIVCLELYESRFEKGDEEVRRKRYDVVRDSYEIWYSRREISKEARRAANVLGAMLKKVGKPVEANSMAISTIIEEGGRSDTGDYAWGMNNMQDIPLDDAGSMDLPIPDYFNTVFGTEDGFNWGYMDHYLGSQDLNSGDSQFFSGWQG